MTTTIVPPPDPPGSSAIEPNDVSIEPQDVEEVINSIEQAEAQQQQPLQEQQQQEPQQSSITIDPPPSNVTSTSQQDQQEAAAIDNTAQVDTDDDVDDTILTEDDMALAAAAAAASLVCRICGQVAAPHRPLLVFQELSSYPPLVETMSQTLYLHVFCGKTAGILPTVASPQWEILSKAGLKNKHGIGPQVNMALARTRCAMAGGKPYYLVREFEAHLSLIRQQQCQQQQQQQAKRTKCACGGILESKDHLHSPQHRAWSLKYESSSQQDPLADALDDFVANEVVERLT